LRAEQLIKKAEELMEKNRALKRQHPWLTRVVGTIKSGGRDLPAEEEEKEPAQKRKRARKRK